MKIPNFSFQIVVNQNHTTQGFVNQDSETKQILVSNATGSDMNTNIGRKSLVNSHYKRFANIVLQYLILIP